VAQLESEKHRALQQLKEQQQQMEQEREQLRQKIILLGIVSQNR
jgi:hypothetical protein